MPRACSGGFGRSRFDGDASFFRENEPFSLFIKANKPGYVYLLTLNNAEDGQANILLLDWNNQFIKYIDESHVIRHYDITKKECPRYFVQHEDKWKTFKKNVEKYRLAHY